jgi:uncharacterized protein (UPF0264 family)
MKNQRLLVSVRGKNDAIEAVKGGAHIIDAEYPGSALGTCYPANIFTIRKHTPSHLPVSTNIGEKQFIWSTAGQAAVGVAYAGVDIIKVGLADLSESKAKRVMRNVAHQIRFFFKDPPKTMITTFFADENLRKICDPVTHGCSVSLAAGSQGVLIDTFDKECGKGLLDWLSLKEIRTFVRNCHKENQEAWIAGSIVKNQMTALWKIGVDVICIRGAACNEKSGRKGTISAKRVSSLVKTNMGTFKLG